VAAVKRGKAEPLLDDVVLCAQMGWTLDELRRQPARFVEKLAIYLETIGEEQGKEHRRMEDELRRLGRMRS